MPLKMGTDNVVKLNITQNVYVDIGPINPGGTIVTLSGDPSGTVCDIVDTYGYSPATGRYYICQNVTDEVKHLKDTLNNSIHKIISIAFNRNGGSGTTPPTQTKTWGVENITQPSEVITRNGYTFGGWSYSNSATTGISFPFIAPEFDSTLYAVWTLDNYTITFSPNGGTVANTTANYSIETNATLSTLSGTVSRTGYYFNGWKPTTTTGGWVSSTTYASSTNVQGKFGSITLVAQWTLQTYTIYLNYNGGFAGPTSVQYTTTTNSSLGSLVGTATRPNYVFLGWKASSAAGSWVNGDTYQENYSLLGKYGDVTLTAQWGAPATINFNVNGGTGSVGSINTYIGVAITLPTYSGTRGGYTRVNSWNTNSAGTGTAYSYSSSFTPTASSQTLYATWTPINYTLTIDRNSGYGGNASATYNASMSSSLTTLAGNIDRIGYTLTGWKWTTASIGGWISGATYTTTQSVSGKYGSGTIQAQWTPNVYTVTFDSTGGSTPSPSSKEVTYATTYGTLPSVTRSGYTFKGWYTAPSGGYQMTAGSVMNEDNDHTLYAQWTANTYTVTFYSMGGVDPTPFTSKTVTFGSTYGTLPTTTREAHTFKGWYTSGSGGTKIESTSTVSTASNHNLYAQWTPITYSISTSTGTGVASMSVSPTTYTYSTSDQTVTITRSASTGYSLNIATITGDNTSPTVSGTQVTIPAYSYGNFTVNQTASLTTYTITADRNGGTGGNASGTYNMTTSKTLASLLGTPTKTGYTLDGWKWTSSTAGGWINGKTYETTQNVYGKYASGTMQAQWKLPTVPYGPSYGVNMIGYMDNEVLVFLDLMNPNSFTVDLYLYNAPYGDTYQNLGSGAVINTMNNGPGPILLDKTYSQLVAEGAQYFTISAEFRKTGYLPNKVSTPIWVDPVNIMPL